MKSSYIFLAVVCVLLWGAQFVVSKWLVAHLSPMGVTALRFGIMGLIGSIWAPIPDRKNLLKIFFISITLFSFPIGATSWALTRLEAGLAAFITELEVPLAVLLGALYFREALQWKQILGLILSLLGIYIILESPDITTGEFFPLFLMLLVAWSYAISSLQIKSISMPAIAITTWGSFIACLSLAFLSWLQEPEFISQLAKLDAFTAMVIFLISVGSLYSFNLWSWLLGTHSVSQIVPFASLVPLSSCAFAYLTLGETLSSTSWIGGILTLLGVALPFWRKF